MTLTGVFRGDDPNGLTVRPYPCSAPSWPWASVKTTTGYEEHSGFHPALAIHAANVPLSGSDVTGEIAYGELIVSGVLTPRRCLPVYGGDEWKVC
jgi:hypothetical protein